MTPTAATPIQTQFLQAMVARGWRTDRVRVDVALKDYDTAAGGRTAVVYCRENSDGDHVLTGDYQSEGRNALSTCWALFRPETDETTIASEIERFAATPSSLKNEVLGISPADLGWLGGTDPKARRGSAAGSGSTKKRAPRRASSSGTRKPRIRNRWAFANYRPART